MHFQKVLNPLLTDSDSKIFNTVFHVQNIMLAGTSVNIKANLLIPRALDDLLLGHYKFSTKYSKSVTPDFLNILKIKFVLIIF